MVQLLNIIKMGKKVIEANIIEVEDSVHEEHPPMQPVNIKQVLHEENMSRSGKIFSIERMMCGNKEALQTPKK